MLLNVSGVAATSGGSTPLAFLLGGIACLALAFVVIGFTRRMASAGYAYTYASRSLGKGAGFMAGWLYFFGMICFVPMTMSGVGYLAADLLGAQPQLVDPVLLHRDGAVPVPVGHQDQGHHPGAAVRRHRHRRRHRDRRPGDDGQGRQPRAGAVGVQLRALAARRLQRRLLRDHPGRHLLHRLRDRGRLRRGDLQPAPLHPDRGDRGHAVRRRLLPVDHLLDHDRLRRQQRGQVRAPTRSR